MGPAFYFYAKNKALSDFSVDLDRRNWALSYLLGNVGFSKEKCGATYIANNGTGALNCEKGLITSNYFFGVIPSGVESYNEKSSPFYNTYSYCASANSSFAQQTTNGVSIEYCSNVALNT